MYNKIILIGNLGKTPELSKTPDGQPVINLLVATNRRWVQQDGETIERTVWFNCSVWGKQAESCSENLLKGDRVMVEGKMQEPHINLAGYATNQVYSEKVKFL